MEIRSELLMILTFLGVLVAFTMLVYHLLFVPLIEKSKILETAVFPSKLPEEGKKILDKYNITCFGYSCYEYHRYDGKTPMMECWIVLGRKVGEGDEGYCLISGKSFGVSCIKTETGWECSEAAYSPYEAEEYLLKILYWDSTKRSCCYLKGFSNKKPYYECFPSTLINCTMQLLR
ncbi:hypothetical protein J7M00_08025 [bacterium]|nr:hypothetical protein [bacterium]